MRYTSRKFVVAASVIVSNAYLVYAGHIADGVYSAVAIAVVTVYLTANVAQKASLKVG